MTTSPDGTTVLAGAAGTITDAGGGAWTFNHANGSNFSIYRNGASAGGAGSPATASIVIYSGVVYAFNPPSSWYAWDGSSWGNPLPNPAPSSPPPPPVIYGTLARPFSATSPWNTPIPSSAVLLPATDQRVIDFRDPAKGNTWVMIEDVFSEPPISQWKATTFNDGGTFSADVTIPIPTPAGFMITHTSDGWVIFPDPDGIHLWEMWAASNGSTAAAYGPPSYSAAYVVRSRLDGTGWGTMVGGVGVGAGIRAAGASLLGGVIQKWEMDAGVIQHAMAIELSMEQLKAGTVQTAQFIPPAVAADYGSVENYTGTIPMGARFVMPAATDISSLWPGGKVIAQAYKTYGGYVVDGAGATTSLGMASRCLETQANDIWTDIEWIRQHLVMVSP